MNAAKLLVKCLENEGVEYIFGIPGEENIHFMDALIGSPIKFITTRHEQGAAFMADVYGRLTGRAGVCLATLGPGATNLVTGIADANMDRAPVVALAGQASTERMHKESHQHYDLVRLFEPISKYSASIPLPTVIPEIVRKSFKLAQSEKPGVCFIELPENIASWKIDKELAPIKVQFPELPSPCPEKIEKACQTIAAAKNPIVLAGNGVIRQNASATLSRFAELLNLPVATSFMAKGAIPTSHPNSLGAIGLKSNDFVGQAFEMADVVICVGYDMVEYSPEYWNRNQNKKIIHIDSMPAEVDEHYVLEVGIESNISMALELLIDSTPNKNEFASASLKEQISAEYREHEFSQSFPVLPQKIVWDLRAVLENDDIVISDVGAHKMWMSRMYQAERPNTCIVSNGFAAMGIAVPGAIAAKLAFPSKRAVAVTGDAGFMMNSQEIETAMRIGTPTVNLIWNDSQYGLIKWHQLKHFGRSTNIDFDNPDFVKYAESFGAKGFRVGAADELQPILEEALKSETVCIIDCPVDYSENMKLTEKLNALGQTAVH